MGSLLPGWCQVRCIAFLLLGACAHSWIYIYIYIYMFGFPESMGCPDSACHTQIYGHRSMVLINNDGIIIEHICSCGIYWRSARLCIENYCVWEQYNDDMISIWCCLLSKGSLYGWMRYEDTFEYLMASIQEAYLVDLTKLDAT
jgi:hypothetical protein